MLKFRESGICGRPQSSHFGLPYNHIQVNRRVVGVAIEDAVTQPEMADSLKRFIGSDESGVLTL